MKRKLHFFLGTLILCMTVGCKVGKTEVKEASELYAEFIAKITAGLADGFQTVSTEELGISFVFNYGADTLGYCYMDLDGDGTEELLLGEDGEGTWANTIYDIFTMRDGKLVHVVAGGERNRYYLTDKGMGVLANEASSGAASSYNAYYNYRDEGLELIEAVVYDGWRDEEHPWFYSNESISSENAESIYEEAARDIIASYEYEEIEFILFQE